MSAKIANIFHLFRVRGNSAYMIGEKITQYDHAVQSWRWMKNRPTSPALQCAAFLHDIGHLTGKHIDPFRDSVDDKHELQGTKYLKILGFPETVWEPVRMHVDAKRYLCSTNLGSEYNATLSNASKRTLELQGGKMTEKEISDFLNSRYWRDALLLRFSDDQGKEMSSEPLSELELAELEESMLFLLREKV